MLNCSVLLMLPKAVFTAVLVTGLSAGTAACVGNAAESTRRDIVLAKEYDSIEAVVPPNATFDSLLRSQNLDETTTRAVVSALSTAFNPRLLKTSQPYWLVRSLDGRFREFRYEIDAAKFLRVTPEGDGFAAAVVAYPRAVEIAAVSAEITKENNSLIGAFEAGGENIQLPLLLAEVFGGILDFNSDLQRGDRFEVLFERILRDGEFSSYGELSAARLHHGGKVFTAIRAKGPDGKLAWYDENGRSTKRQFLASPLKFNPRVTSGFSRNRKHPVYGFNRAHLGVDYGAPHGSAVLAVSAGTVVSAGWAGDGGRQIRLRHAGGYESYYLHLSRFATGIQAGARVNQSEVIGYVGATGAATGPHLDFRIRRDGVFVNPVLERQRMPPGEPIPASLLDEFKSDRDRVLADLKRRLSANQLRANRP
jgi:murein DD-endopeptidase MepM/ murein hydrolase activator NlpD